MDSPFIVRDSRSMALVYNTAFATYEEAETAAKAVIGDGSYRIEALQSYGMAAQHHFVEEQKATRTADRLITAITEHLDAVDGAIDVEEFIAEHQELADAIGYEFEEEKTYLIEVKVTAKVKRGYGDVTWSTFELDVDSVDSDVEVLDFEVRDCNEY
jgi:hypothetical protein